MSSKKYYVIIRGRKKGIYDDWFECQSVVESSPHPWYKGFINLQDAVDYIEDYMYQDSKYVIKIHGYDKWFNDYNSFIYELEQIME